MSFLKKFKFLIVPSVIVAVVVVYFIVKPAKPPRRDTIIVSLEDVVQNVNVVGNVKAAKNVELAFETGGKVKDVFANVGTNVKSGDKLAELNNSGVLADLQQAQAQVLGAIATLDQYKAVLFAEQARLSEMESGTRQEELKIAQTKVDNAQSVLLNVETDLVNAKKDAETDLANLYGDVLNILNDAYAKADDAVNKQMDDMFTGKSNVRLTFSSNNSQLEVNTLNTRQDSVNALVILRGEIDKPHLTNGDYDRALFVGNEHILKVRNLLNLISDLLKGSTSLSSTDLSTYKTNLGTARTNVNIALTNINTQQQLISTQVASNTNTINTAQSTADSARFSLQSAQEELNLKLAGYTKEQIDAQKAKIQQAQANIVSQRASIAQKQASVASAKAQVEKNIIYSPIDGIVTKQDAKVGEIVSAQVSVISVISEAKFQIEANVPEVDISKIKIGNTAIVTLDAYGTDEIFEAAVILIDPAEKIIEGVSTYKITLQFVNGNEKIKSGMTADLEIMTDKKENVIAIPQRAISIKDNKKMVKILRGQEIIEVEVITGLRGSSGLIEIISGVKEGDTVITFME